jgi:site-specific recombinase XerD
MQANPAAIGSKLANSGVDLRTMQDYVGHRIPNTVRYTHVAGRRFEGLWR